MVPDLDFLGPFYGLYMPLPLHSEDTLGRDPRFPGSPLWTLPCIPLALPERLAAGRHRFFLMNITPLDTNFTGYNIIAAHGSTPCPRRLPPTQHAPSDSPALCAAATVSHLAETRMMTQVSGLE